MARCIFARCFGLQLSSILFNCSTLSGPRRGFPVLVFIGSRLVFFAFAIISPNWWRWVDSSHRSPAYETVALGRYATSPVKNALTPIGGLQQ